MCECSYLCDGGTLAQSRLIRRGFGWRSRQHAGSFSGHAVGLHVKVKLQLRQLLRLKCKRLRPRAAQAVAQAPLERSHGLPIQPVHRVADRVSLRNDAPAQSSAGVVVVALRPQQPELARALHEAFLAALLIRPQSCVVGRPHNGHDTVHLYGAVLADKHLGAGGRIAAKAHGLRQTAVNLLAANIGVWLAPASTLGRRIQNRPKFQVLRHHLAAHRQRILSGDKSYFVDERFKVNRVLVQIDALPETGGHMRVAHGMVDQQVGETNSRSTLQAPMY